MPGIQLNVPVYAQEKANCCCASVLRDRTASWTCIT